jgi:hypothetical protein
MGRHDVERTGRHPTRATDGDPVRPWPNDLEHVARGGEVERDHARHGQDGD